MELQNCMTDMLSTLASGFGDKALMLVDKDGTPAGHILGTEMVGAMEYEHNKHNRVPWGYTELAYLESTGTQWIDTGIGSIVNLKTEVVCQQTSLGSGYPTIVGAFESSSGYKVIFGYNGAVFYSQCGNGSGYVNLLNYDTAKHTIVVDNGTDSQSIQIDSQSYTSSYAITTGSNVSVALFARKSYTGTTVNFVSMKLWSAKFYRSGDIIMNLIPAKRNSDGVVGMYDLVSNTFLTNAGTGTFSYGEL